MNKLNIEFNEYTKDTDKITIYQCPDASCGEYRNEVLGYISIEDIIANKALYQRLAREFRELIQIG